MNDVRLAHALPCAIALFLPGCYWLAKYSDLSSDYGDASLLDAGQVLGEAGQPFCPEDAGAFVYCTSFDGVDAGVLGVDVSGATVAIVDGPDLSPPSSLAVGLVGDSSFGRYRVPFSFEPTTTTLQFEMLSLYVNEGVTTTAITLSQASTQTARTLNVVVAPVGQSQVQYQVQEYIALPDGGSEINAHAWYQPDAGVLPTWHHVVLTLTADDATQQYTSGLTIDGQVFEEGQPLVLPWAQGLVDLDVGVTFAALGGPQFYFDNVRADFGP